MLPFSMALEKLRDIPGTLSQCLAANQWSLLCVLWHRNMGIRREQAHEVIAQPAITFHSVRNSREEMNRGALVLFHHGRPER